MGRAKEGGSGSALSAEPGGAGGSLGPVGGLHLRGMSLSQMDSTVSVSESMLKKDTLTGQY